MSKGHTEKESSKAQTPLVVGQSLPYVAPAGTLDLEYTEGTKPSAPHGLEVKCPYCGNALYLKFDISMTAWNSLLDLTTALSGVSRRELQRSDGRRPSIKVHQARALLAQALFKVAGEDIATNWLRTIYGWTAKRVATMSSIPLDNADYIYLLKNLGKTMQINLQVESNNGA